MGLLAGTAAATAICGAALYVAFRPKKHLNIINLNAPESALLGHMPFIEEGYNNKCFHNYCYYTFVKTKFTIINLSLPMHQCNLVTTGSGILKFMFNREFESFEKGAIQRERRVYSPYLLNWISLNMTIAGMYITRALLSWFFYIIENKPAIIKKFSRKSITFRNPIFLFTRHQMSFVFRLNFWRCPFLNILLPKEVFVTHFAKKKMKYTECALLETLMLYPPVGSRGDTQYISFTKKQFYIRKGESFKKRATLKIIQDTTSLDKLFLFTIEKYAYG
ncbi:hypothetical protein RFI_37214 [Reticulomyxa filosa]|uniref:Uncharacterized protein n=1 Tax=Reticulomyxa filosa TaxID=46433 RepID=X6LF80_RETFI|nr:hypothetical protein RFI_37214 [Reticulomyxa filosa]|eukprot:ETO00234.1 hypothetical protein RFI_37214 [Reticulomyxa filosa]